MQVVENKVAEGEGGATSPLGNFRFVCFLRRRELRLYVNFARSNLHVVRFDLVARGPGDYASRMHVELRSVPRTLHCAADDCAIGQWPSAMSAMVADGEDSIGAAPDCHTLFPDVHEHHVAFAKFALVTRGPIKTLNSPFLKLIGVRITAVDSDLVAIDQS